MKKIVIALLFLTLAWAESNEWMDKWTNPSDEPKASQNKDEVKSVAYYKQNRDEARNMVDKCMGKMMIIGQMGENELAKIESEDDAEKFFIKKMGKTLYQNCQNAMKVFE